MPRPDQTLGKFPKNLAFAEPEYEVRHEARSMPKRPFGGQGLASNTADQAQKANGPAKRTKLAKYTIEDGSLPVWVTIRLMKVTR